MRTFQITVVCAVMFLLAGIADVSAAAKGKTSRKASNPAADNMQCNEVTLIGTISDEKQQEHKDKEGKVIATYKYYVLTDSKKKEWTIFNNKISGEKWKMVVEASGSKVKIVGMVLGSGNSLISVKKLDKM